MDKIKLQELVDKNIYTNDNGEVTAVDVNDIVSEVIESAQFEQDEMLETQNKTVVGAINEVNTNKLDKSNAVGVKNDQDGEVFNNYKYNKALGIYSHAEGSNTTAVGRMAHAEGESTNTLPEGLVLSNNTAVQKAWDETKFSLASGQASHVEGKDCLALDAYSHAEGFRTRAIGGYSHAEGGFTIAEGGQSHAEGELTAAIGRYSHAEGENTTAQNYAEHAEGKYNKSNTGTISSIGIGDDRVRKNAVEVMGDGKVFIIGLGRYNGTNPEVSKDIKSVIDSIIPSSSAHYNMCKIHKDPSVIYFDVPAALKDLKKYLGDELEYPGTMITFRQMNYNWPRTMVYDGGVFTDEKSWKELQIIGE